MGNPKKLFCSYGVRIPNLLRIPRQNRSLQRFLCRVGIHCSKIHLQHLGPNNYDLPDQCNNPNSMENQETFCGSCDIRTPNSLRTHHQNRNPLRFLDKAMMKYNMSLIMLFLMSNYEEYNNQSQTEILVLRYYSCLFHKLNPIYNHHWCRNHQHFLHMAMMGYSSPMMMSLLMNNYALRNNFDKIESQKTFCCNYDIRISNLLHNCHQRCSLQYLHHTVRMASSRILILLCRFV